MRNGSPAAVLYCLVIGVVQAALWVGFARSTEPAHTGADRGFADWNILGEAAWLAALVVASVLLVCCALAALRVRLPAVVALVVLAFELTASGFLAQLVPTLSDWRALVDLLPLTIAIVAAQRFLVRPCVSA